jgi:hypothetical protein
MASSDKKIAANRENARRSTGPRTPEGKHRARRNGITHGLTTTAMLLEDEDPADYNAFVEATLDDLGPRSDHERALALNVATTIWRRDRLYAAEVAFLNVRTRTLRAQNPDVRSSAEAQAMMLMDSEDSNRMRLLARYLNAAERACNKAVDAYWAARNAVLRADVEEMRLCESIGEHNQQAVMEALDRLEAEQNTSPAPPEPPQPRPRAAESSRAPEPPRASAPGEPELPLSYTDPKAYLARLIAEGKLSPRPLAQEDVR